MLAWSGQMQEGMLGEGADCWELQAELLLLPAEALTARTVLAPSRDYSTVLHLSSCLRKKVVRD